MARQLLCPPTLRYQQSPVTNTGSWSTRTSSRVSSLYQRRQGSRQLNGGSLGNDSQASELGKVAHTVWPPCWPLRAVPAEMEAAQRWPAAGDNGVDGQLAGKRIQVHKQRSQPGAAPEVLQAWHGIHTCVVAWTVN